jgi:hypothetical protein
MELHGEKMAGIVYEKDKYLLVHIDRSSRTAPVTFQYTAFDDAPVQSTPFQTADMPGDDQEAAAKVDRYAESVAG